MKCPLSFGEAAQQERPEIRGKTGTQLSVQVAAEPAKEMDVEKWVLEQEARRGEPFPNERLAFLSFIESDDWRDTYWERWPLLFRPANFKGDWIDS